MKGRKRKRCCNNKSILTYGKVQMRSLRDIPGTKWLPSDSDNSSKDIFGDSTNSFLNTFSEKMAAGKNINKNKSSISIESDDEDFVQHTRKKSLRVQRNCVARQPDWEDNAKKVNKVRSQPKTNSRRNKKEIVVVTQGEQLKNSLQAMISEYVKNSVEIADLNEQNPCIQSLNKSEEILTEKKFIFNENQENIVPDVLMMSCLSLHNTVINHAPDIEMDSELLVKPSVHGSAAESTPVVSRVSTRSFFKNKLDNSAIRYNISDKLPNKDIKGVKSKTPNDETGTGNKFAIPSVTLKKNSIMPAATATVQVTTNNVNISKAKSNTTRKNIRVKRPKKAPVWKKCPGTNLRTKQRIARTKNESILQQIMVNGNIDTKFKAAGDSLTDIYRVDNTESFEKSLQIKLPRNNTPDMSDKAIEKKDKPENSRRKTNKRKNQTRKTEITTRKARQKENFFLFPSNETSEVVLPQPVVVINVKDNKSVERTSVSHPQCSDHSKTLSIDEKDILVLSAKSSGMKVTEVQRKSKIQSKSVTKKNSSNKVSSSSKKQNNSEKIKSVKRKRKQKAIKPSTDARTDATIGARRSRRKHAVINYKDLSLKGLGMCSVNENKSSPNTVKTSRSDVKADTNIKTIIPELNESKEISNKMTHTAQTVARVTLSPVSNSNHITCRGRKKRRVTAPVVQSDNSSLFSTLSLTLERHMTSVHSTSLNVPMHAFSTINLTEEEQHGGILSDDESVNVGLCMAKRVSTPLVADVIPIPPNKLYNSYASTPHKETIKTVAKQPVVSDCTALKSSLNAFSPITNAMSKQCPSDISSHTVSSPLILNKILHPRLASLKHHGRTTSTPNSNQKRKINSTEQQKSVFSPIPSLIRDAPIPGTLSAIKRQRLGSYLDQTSTPRRPRSPGSHLSSSKTQLADGRPLSASEKRHSLDSNSRSQMLESVKMDLSSLFSQNENGDKIRNQNHRNLSIPDKCIQARLSLQAVEALNNTESIVCFPRQSLGFVDALTPRRARTGTGRILTPREKVLCECEQSEPIPFEGALADIITGSCVKLGEGLYGEVYRCHYKGEDNPVALKVIPIEGELIVNEEKQKTFEEMLPEVVSSKELHALRNHTRDSTDGFIELKKILCVQGTYPNLLIDAWDRYNQEATSENDRPNAFTTNQLYVVFKFADGGKDVEHFRFKTACQAYSVLQQVCVALAIAERTLEFEHRDLHWGNILVSQTKDKEMSFRIDNKHCQIKTYGVKASIIDFTLSRVSKGGVTVFQDLAADPALFTMDREQDYQFEIYRMMKQVIKNHWSKFEPKTNVYWMHYLTHKFRNKIYFSNKKYKYHRSYMVKLLHLWEDILYHDSCLSMLKNSKLINEDIVS